MTTNSWDNTVTVILIQRVNKYSPAKEMVTQLHSSQVYQLTFKKIATCKNNNKSNNDITIQRTTLNITLNYVCFMWQLFSCSQSKFCGDLGSARHSATVEICISMCWKGPVWVLPNGNEACGENIVLSRGLWCTKQPLILDRTLALSASSALHFHLFVFGACLWALVFSDSTKTSSLLQAY